jgi:hypothetical protein
MDEHSHARRGNQRVIAHLLCDFKAGTSWQLATLHDLSPEGFRIFWHHGCAVGAKVWIKIKPLAPVSAEVRWCEGSFIGCQFSSPLSPYVFEHLVSRASDGTGPGQIR